MTGSAPGLLVLHAVRVLGFADLAAVAARFEVQLALAGELLEDARAHGWVSSAAFAGIEGWSLTALGRAENERMLAAELDQCAARGAVEDVYEDFLPLNGRLQRACTRWQLRPTPGDPLAANDHSDLTWDREVLSELAALGAGLERLVRRLVAVLPRFGGYDARFLAASGRAREGDWAWVDRTDVDSCHRVWFELHEDLVATLGIDRHSQR